MKIPLFSLFFFAALAVAPAMAADYPPYPDVWGRELAAPQGRIVNGFYVRDAGNGDFALAYTHHAADPQTGNLQGGGDWTRLDFFSGSAVRLDEDAADAMRRALALPRPRIESRDRIWLYLPGETQVKPFSRELKGVGCWVNYAGSLVLRDAREQILADRVVLRLLDTPERREYWDRCQRTVDESSYLARVDALSFVLYPLKDGTFLAEGSASPFMIRFRPDLTSPYVDAHPNLLLVETAEVDRVVRAAYAAADGFRIQAANDALYDYVTGLRRAKAGR